jgi:short-subunit dehydrogenase
MRVLITGASSGIGEAFAYWYADNASELVLVGRNKSELDRVASKVRSQGVHAEVIVADLAHKDGVESVGPLMSW